MHLSFKKNYKHFVPPHTKKSNSSLYRKTRQDSSSMLLSHDIATIEDFKALFDYNTHGPNLRHAMYINVFAVLLHWSKHCLHVYLHIYLHYSSLHDTSLLYNNIDRGQRHITTLYTRGIRGIHHVLFLGLGGMTIIKFAC